MKYVSEFVKRQHALNARIKTRLVWNSDNKNTYIKAKHGELINDVQPTERKRHEKAI